MVSKMDIHRIGEDYFNLPHTRRKRLPFSDAELEAIALYNRADNKRKLSNEVLQLYREAELKYIYLEDKK